MPSFYRHEFVFRGDLFVFFPEGEERLASFSHQPSPLKVADATGEVWHVFLISFFTFFAEMFLWLTRSSTEGLTESQHYTTDAMCVWEGVFSLVSSPVHLHSAPFLLTAKNSTTRTHIHTLTKTSFSSIARCTLTHLHTLTLMGSSAAHTESAL